MTEISVRHREKSKNKVYCAVPGCNNNSQKCLDVVFHYFPELDKRFVYKQNHFGMRDKIDQHALWKRLTKVNSVNKFTKICSKHFVPDDYIHPNDEGVKKFLRKCALPSRNLPNVDLIKQEKKIEKDEQRQKRRAKREERNQNIETKKIKLDKSSEQNKEKVPAESAEFEDDQSLIDIGDSDFQNENSVSGVQEASTRTVEIQVNSGDFRMKFIDQLRNDADLSTATGIESFALLETILDIVKTADLRKDDSLIRTNLRDRVILTFVKLKQNLSYAFLSILFNYTDRHCQRIFRDTIALLSTCLRQFIAWPAKEEILKNMPLCFAKYQNVRVVVDCTEFYIQNPKNLCCQVLTYSYYKSAQTCKVMTGVTPAGNISFVSKVYGGRCSDKSIFEQSKIIRLCEPGDAVMVDRGFLIDNICDLYGIKCIRPPFLKGERQFTKSDANLTSDIAKARVHVERSNQRIKMFQMLGDTLPTHLVPLLDDILTIVCAVVNLSAPIMKDDKFMDA